MTPPLEELRTDDAQVCDLPLATCVRYSTTPTHARLSAIAPSYLDNPHIHPYPHGESADFAAHRLCGDVELEMATARVGANPDYETVPCSVVVDSVAAVVDAPSDAKPLQRPLRRLSKTKRMLLMTRN
eukprot:4486821-Pleurochrysis_carterae.AAC.1